MHSMDLRETKDNFTLTFELPGAKEDDIILQAEENSVRVICSSKALEMKSQGQDIDINYNEVYYDKTFVLPCKGNYETMTYVFFMGFLEVTIPKIK
ncbi:MAG: Hsp20/alpha crystallin family protein [Nanoarchaeota archaeon]|nr:Hsp20/alpha crystallin family protein [Nanoarchaeota archaeon]